MNVHRKVIRRNALNIVCVDLQELYKLIYRLGSSSFTEIIRYRMIYSVFFSLQKLSFYREIFLSLTDSTLSDCREIATESTEGGRGKLRTFVCMMFFLLVILVP